MNENNKGYSDYGRIDLMKENIEPVEGSSEFYSSGVESERIDLTREEIEPITSSSELYSEELPFQAERIDLTKEDIPPVINNNVQVKQEEIEIKDYDSEKGISQVYIPEVPENKLSQKIMKIVLIILGVLFVIGIGFYIYSNQPKQLFLTSINKMYSNLTDNYYKVADLAPDKDGVVSNSVHTNFSLKTTSQEYAKLADTLNEMEINLKTENDFKNKVLAYNLELKSGETNVISSDIYGAPSELYLDFKDLFTKFIKIDLDDDVYNAYFEGTNVKDIEECLDRIKNTYLSHLSSDDFTKIKEEIIVNGKTYKATKITLELDEIRINEINNASIDDILKDEKILEKMINISGMKKSEITEKIKELKQNINVNINADIYVYKKNPIKIDLKINNENENRELVINDIDNYFDLTYKENNHIILSIITHDNKTTINETGTIIEIIKETENEYSFVITSNYEKTEGTFKINKKEISDKEVINTIVVTLKLDAVSTLTINTEIDSKVIDKVTLPDITNSVNAEDLTEEEINAIVEKFLNDLSGLELNLSN